MMRRKTILMLTLLVFFCSLVFAVGEANASDNIRVIIDGYQVTFDNQPPTIVNGRTLVPARGVFEQMGFYVSWNGVTRQATLTTEQYVVVLTIGSNIFTTNGTAYTLDVPAQIIGGSTMIPLRAVLESVGYYLDWDGSTRTVIISSTPITSEYVHPELCIVEVAIAAAEEFLMQFPSIFMNTNSSMPDIEMEITNAPWMLGNLYATGFSLWDFGNNGIPWILVYYWGDYEGTGDGGTPTSLFRFIDGQFIRVSMECRWGSGITYGWPSGFEPEYFFDIVGNLVMSTQGVDFTSYYYVSFNNAVASHNRIAITGFYWDGQGYTIVWNNYITGETNIPRTTTHWDRDPNTPRYIPGMPDNVLTPIEPLTELQDRITASINRRLG